MQTAKLIKRTAALIAALAIAAFSAAIPAIADDMPQGSGTEGDPYIITTGAQLAAVGKNEEGVGYITLKNDIDLSAFAGESYIINKLTGKLDGGGHKITGLTLSGGKGTWSESILTGLIGTLSGSVENLTISGAVITGAASNNSVGTLAAFVPRNSVVEIKNCTVTGEIKESNSGSYIGAVIGKAEGYSPYNNPDAKEPAEITFDGCISNVKIDCSNSTYLGGLMGYAATLCDVTVNRCAVLGDINASRYACGIVGSYSGTFNITLADTYFGGKLGGINAYGISYSYNSPTSVICSNFYYDSTKNGKPDLFKYKTESDVPGAKGISTSEIMALASTLEGFESSAEYGGYPVPRQGAGAAFSAVLSGGNATFTAAEGGSYRAVLASYNGGALSDAHTEILTLSKGESKTIPVPSSLLSGGASIKAMLWDGMRPLAKSE